MKFKGSHVVVGFLLHKKLPVSVCDDTETIRFRSDVMGMVMWFDAFGHQTCHRKKPWLWAPGEVGEFQDSIFLHQQKNSQHFRAASCDMMKNIIHDVEIDTIYMFGCESFSFLERAPRSINTLLNHGLRYPTKSNTILRLGPKSKNLRKTWMNVKICLSNSANG